jgi:hypothetical protein
MSLLPLLANITVALNGAILEESSYEAIPAFFILVSELGLPLVTPFVQHSVIVKSVIVGL